MDSAPENEPVSLELKPVEYSYTVYFIYLAIDEEFISQLKLIEADMKRMQALLVSYEE